MDADFLAGVCSAALQDELRTGPGGDDRGFSLALGLRSMQLRNVICQPKSNIKHGAVHLNLWSHESMG